MKKKELMAFTLLAATMLLIAAGCKKEDGAMAENTMSFSVSVAGQGESKAVLYNAAADIETEGNAFVCSAYNNTESSVVFSGETISYSGSRWSTGEEYLWYPGKILTFHAVYPASAADVAAIAADGTGISISNYAIADNAKDQADIMLGYYSGDGNYTGTANIVFNHPFTAVRFKMGDLAELIPGFTSITSIQIANVYDGGALAKWNGGPFEWTPSTTDKIVTMNVSGIFEKGAYVVGTEDNAQAFTLIPQDLATQSVTLIIYYDATVPDTIVAVVDSVSETSTEWEAGKVYTYTINFKSLELTVGGETVQIWGTTDGGAVEANDSEN